MEIAKILLESGGISPDFRCEYFSVSCEGFQFPQQEYLIVSCFCFPRRQKYARQPENTCYLEFEKWNLTNS